MNRVHKDIPLSKTIISVTTHAPRFKTFPRFFKKNFIDHPIDQSKFQIVVSLYDGDADQITPEMHKLEDDGQLIFIFSDRNYGSHKKYYCILKEYPDHNFITIDDDYEYHPKLFQTLVDNSKKFPGCIIGASGNIINKRVPYSIISWMKFPNANVRAKEDTPSAYKKELVENNLLDTPNEYMIFLGGAGTFYPAHCFDKCPPDPECILNNVDVRRNDDIYLAELERRNNLQLVAPTLDFKPLGFEITRTAAMCMNDDLTFETNGYFNRIKHLFKEHPKAMEFSVRQYKLAKSEHYINSFKDACKKLGMEEPHLDEQVLSEDLFEL